MSLTLTGTRTLYGHTGGGGHVTDTSLTLTGHVPDTVWPRRFAPSNFLSTNGAGVRLDSAHDSLVVRWLEEEAYGPPRSVLDHAKRAPLLMLGLAAVAAQVVARLSLYPSALVVALYGLVFPLSSMIKYLALGGDGAGVAAVPLTLTACYGASLLVILALVRTASAHTARGDGIAEEVVKLVKPLPVTVRSLVTEFVSELEQRRVCRARQAALFELVAVRTGDDVASIVFSFLDGREGV